MPNDMLRELAKWLENALNKGPIYENNQGIRTDILVKWLQLEGLPMIHPSKGRRQIAW